MSRSLSSVLSLFFLVFPACLIAQERHMSGDPVSTLCMGSPFAHGYLHGYEEGFHYGDLDLQLGREPRDPSSISSYKRASTSFQPSFGSRSSYRSGYQDGFRAGYSDATRQLNFGAVESLRHAADGVAKLLGAASHQFDKGFREGYSHGRRKGSEDGRAAERANPINPPCLGLAPEYCSGFARGFQIGYGDGFGNQSAKAPPPALEASAK